MRSLVLACAALVVAAPAASAATGDLDRSFGSNGTAIVRFADAAEENPAGLVVQSTGRIVVVGDTDAGRSGAVPARNRLQIVRLHADGSVDTRRRVGLSAGGSLTAVSAVADGDAFYVLARHDLQRELPSCTKRALFDCFDLSHRIAIFRFTAAGALDPSFGGGDGVVLLAAGGEHHGGVGGTDSVTETRVPLAMTVLPGGRVVVADQGFSSRVVRLTRLAPQGAGLDRGFGDGGRAALRVAPSTLAPGPLGSVVAAGTGGVERLTATGARDTSFDGDGLRATPPVGSLVPLPDGGAVVAGTQRTDSFFREPLFATRLDRFGATVWASGADFPRLTPDGNASARTTAAALGLGNLVALGGSVDLDPDRVGDVARHGRLALALLRLDGTAPVHSLFATDIAASEDESIVALASERDGDLVALASVDLDPRPGFIRAAAALVRYRES